MKNKKVFLTIVLTICLIPFFSSLAVAGMVDKASQIVNLLAPTDSPAPMALTSFKKINPDGTMTDFSLPANTVFVITYISWRFMPTTPNSHPLQFRLIQNTVGSRPIYSNKESVGADGYVSSVDEITPGIPLSAWSSNLVFTVVDLANNYAFVPGALNMRVVGFLTPNQ